MGNARTFSVSYSPVDTTLARYGTEDGNATGTLTGTIDKSLTFVNSMYRNSSGTLTEFYVVRKGCKCDSITISTSSRGMVTIDMDWIASSITLTSSANGGLTTPTFVASPTTATPWTNLTGGTSKLSIGGTFYPFKNASVTVNNNIDAVDVDGDGNITWLEPTVKECTFSCELIVQKDTNLETSNMEAGTSQALILTLNSTGPKTITGNLFLDTKEEDDASDETKVQTVKFSGLLDNVSLSS